MIKVEKVSKVYDMGKIKLKVLDEISLNIDKNEYVSIIGPSGSGKSTLMNILGCLDVPSEGKYYFEDEEISNYSENQLADIRNKKIGFIFQKFNLLPKLNAYENVELPLIYRGVDPKERRKRVLEKLEIVGLSDRLDHRPSELSGGQQQRVAIARALVGSPQLILADEPTGNLDSKSGEDVMKTLEELNDSGITIVLITHDLNVANMGNRIVSIRDGMIVNERVT
ncbi:ABC transporter ATP-binding protein [Wukongibacter baidiensis]|uniref:ABC transporter ATP-binding protein n=1 Tax=Wukongibacter baidiensis TaxID=1723361 RepID=UPI003D7F32AD